MLKTCWQRWELLSAGKRSGCGSIVLVATLQVASAGYDRVRTTSGIWMKSYSRSATRGTGCGAQSTQTEIFSIFLYKRVGMLKRRSGFPNYWLPSSANQGSSSLTNCAVTLGRSKHGLRTLTTAPTKASTTRSKCHTGRHANGRRYSGYPNPTDKLRAFCLHLTKSNLIFGPSRYQLTAIS